MKNQNSPQPSPIVWLGYPIMGHVLPSAIVIAAASCVPDPVADAPAGTKNRIARQRNFYPLHLRGDEMANIEQSDQYRQTTSEKAFEPNSGRSGWLLALRYTIASIPYAIATIVVLGAVFLSNG